MATGTEINRGPVAHGPQILVWATKLLPIIQLTIQTFFIKNLVWATSLNFPILSLGQMQQVPLVEQILLTFPEHLSSLSVFIRIRAFPEHLSSLSVFIRIRLIFNVLCSILQIIACLFVFLHLALVLSVLLRLMASGYHSDIFKLFSAILDAGKEVYRYCINIISCMITLC